MSNTTVVLVDVSESMNRPATGEQRRIDVLSTILKHVLLPAMPLIAFNGQVHPLEHGQRLPEPSGGTLMGLALDHAGRLSPRRVIIISDGQPADDKATLAAARALQCAISTFYCGEETDRAAVSFMKRLALCSKGGVGRPLIADLRKPEQITSELRLLLTGPAAP